MFWLAKPYAQDLRERRARAGRAGQFRHAAAHSFDVSASCRIKLMRQFETTEWRCAKGTSAFTRLNRER
jgi:transposase